MESMLKNKYNIFNNFLNEIGSIHLFEPPRTPKSSLGTTLNDE